ncbi:MAG: YbhB/YbcL family Raf kinase inhibitor-like protein [Candidatus Omnitrophota bacterium]
MRKQRVVWIVGIICVLVAVANAGFALELRSDAFERGRAIPVQYTLFGEDKSPALMWADVPEDTKSFVLLAEDSDAPIGIWVHWLAFNIPGNFRKLLADVPKEKIVEGGICQGMNSFRRIGYNGPKPPQGSPHRYIFRLYALDIILALPAGAGKTAVVEMMKGHVLEEAEFFGIFGRNMM